MGRGFRKRLRLFPGAWINLLKRGASVSVGRHDATVNIGRKGVRETFGFPDTGLSYQTRPIPYHGDARMGIVLLIRTPYLRLGAALSMTQSLTATMLRDTQSLTWRYVVRNKIFMIP